MGKNFKLILFVSLVLGGNIGSACFGNDFSKPRFGLSILVGSEANFIHNKPDVTIVALLPRVGFGLHKNWELELEGNYSRYNLSLEKDLYFIGIHTNILFKPIQRKWGSFFLLAGGGIGYDNSGGKVKEIGDSHFAATALGGAGFQFNVGKKMALRGEYRFQHISEPFVSDDRGLNTHGLLFGVSF